MVVFKCFKLLLMMICAIVGVGFVSGAEIYRFYARFGEFAYFGIMIFACLIFFLVLKILKDFDATENCVKMNKSMQNYAKNTILNKSQIKSVLVFFNLVLVSSAMFAGLFSLIQELCFNNCYIFVIFAILFVFLVLFFGVSGLEKFDWFVFGFLVILTVYFLIDMPQNFKSFEVRNGDETLSFTVKNLGLSAFFAMLYVFMNVVQIRPVLAESGIRFSRTSTRIFAGVFVGLLSCLLLIFVSFLKNNPQFFDAEMPFFKHFQEKGGVFKFMYVLGLILALFSSLLSCLVGVKKGVARVIKSNATATGLAIFLCLFFSMIGFSNFVKIVYPIIGVINFVIFVFL